MAKISIARNDYFKALNLQQDPFDNSYSRNSYFITPELQHRLELCKHLLEFSQQILLIKGPEKAGKTSFCLHMKDSADSDWIFCHIEASEEIGPDDLVKALLREHHDMLDDTTETISALNEYLKYCNTHSKVPILIVDKVGSLNQASLRFIFQLMEFKEEDTFIRVVLTGDDSFLERLNEVAEDKSNSNLIHSVSIPIFSAEQSVQYLQHRLRASEAREDMFSGKEMNRIHKVAAGIAGDLNFLARQGLSDPAALIPEAPALSLARGKAKKAKQLSILIFSAFLLTVLILLVSTSFWEEQDGQTLMLTVSLPPQAPPLPDMIAPDAALEEPETLPDAWMDEQTVETRIASSNLINELTGINDGYTEKIEEVAITKKAPVEASEPEESLNIAPKAEIETSIGPIRGTKWLLTQSPQSYVLQLMGAVEISTISGFLQNAGLDRSKLALYTIKKSNKDWHVLVYGQFADVVKARAKIGLLSEEAQSQKPWPKAISSIHEAIKNTEKSVD